MTHAQKKAANPNHSVWVGASAGTGKTKVLTDRVLRLLLSGVAPSHIVCLTYTNAAAAEMSSRLQEKLGEWAIMDDAALRRHIHALTEIQPDQAQLIHARQLFASLLDSQPGLSIQTIHAFCQSLISRFPLEANITPDAALMDDLTAKELLNEAKLRLLSNQEQYDTALHQAIITLTWQLHEGSFTDLLKHIINKRQKFLDMLHTHTLESPHQAIFAKFDLAMESSEESIKATFCKQTDDATLCQAVLQMQEGGTNDKKYSAIMAEWLASNTQDRIAYIDQYCTAFLTSEGSPRKTVVTKGLVKKHQELESILQQEQERVLRLQDQLKSYQIAMNSVYIIRVADALLSIYQDLKQQKGLLDYNDLIYITLKLVSNTETAPWVLYKLDAAIEHLLIDEAQDTGPAQWQFIQALCQEWFAGEGQSDTQRTLFVVGDEKQSIYSFQGADVQSFNHMHNHYASLSQEASHPWHSINLDRSFRSTPAVLETVDLVFSDPVLKQAVSFSKDAIQHTPHRQGNGGVVEIWPLVSLDKSSEDIEPWPLPAAMTPIQDPSFVLAEKIADTIEGWLKNKRVLPSKGRPVVPDDIMILVKSRNQLVEQMIRSLKKRQIPVTGLDRMKLTDHIAVMDMIALGNFLLLPSDDLTLATILKSPLFGVSEKELFTLAYNRGDKISLWQRLKQLASEKNIYHHAYTQLSDLLGKTDILSPFQLYSTILEVNNGRAKMVCRLSHEANDVLDEFLTLAMQYETLHTPSLQGFIHWLTTSNMEIKRDMDQSHGEIRVMTIHGSKGLQAPIVFLPDTMQLSRNDYSFFWTEDEPSLLLYSTGKKYDNDHCKTLREQEKQHSFNEYIRLLYVAMTRPEDELYICGAQGSRAAPAQCWYHLVRNLLEPHAENINIGEKKPLLRITSPQTVPVSSHNDNTIQDETILPLPEYFLKTARQENIQTTSIAPSRTKDNQEQRILQSKAIEKGNLTHKLLEVLPNIEPSLQQKMAHSIAAPYASWFSDNAVIDIIHQVITIIENPDYRFMFSSQSRAEVPIKGNINGQSISGQIDRLVVQQDTLWIIDYKTNHAPPDTAHSTPVEYLRQLAYYYALLQPLYPHHQVKTALLWTENAQLMDIPYSLIDKHLPFTPLTSGK